MEAGQPTPFDIAAPIDEMASALLRLDQQGMPFFADSLELAERLLRHVLRHLPNGKDRSALLLVQQRVQQLFQTAMPSGHFIAVAGLPRPRWLGKGGALSVPELRGLLGRKTAPASIT
jgi:hypothetical protein